MEFLASSSNTLRSSSSSRMTSPSFSTRSSSSMSSSCASGPLAPVRDRKPACAARDAGAPASDAAIRLAATPDSSCRLLPDVLGSLVSA